MRAGGSGKAVHAFGWREQQAEEVHAIESKRADRSFVQGWERRRMREGQKGKEERARGEEGWGAVERRGSRGGEGKVGRTN